MRSFKSKVDKKNLDNNLKDRKIFLKKDIFVYIALLVLIALLFLVFIILPKAITSNGFAVYVEDDCVIKYTYDNQKIEIASDWQDKVVVSDNKITIYFSESEYNEITINFSEKSVKMTDSTCSKTRDCVYEPKITNSGIIYCAPHKLKITPLKLEKSSPIIG